MKSNLDKLRVSKNIPNEVLPYANTIIDATVEAIEKDATKLYKLDPQGFYYKLKQLLKGGVK